MENHITATTTQAGQPAQLSTATTPVHDHLAPQEAPAPALSDEGRFSESGGHDEADNACKKMLKRLPDNAAATKGLAFAYLRDAGADRRLTLPERVAQTKAMRILICVPVWNRKKITELVLNNLMKYKKDATLWVYNDWSTEYDNDFLEPLCDKVIKLPPSEKIVVRNEKNVHGMGVQNLRWHQFRDFLRQDSWNYLYFTDNDALHDPDFIDTLKALVMKSGNLLPACLYSTRWHSNNLEKRFGDIEVRRHAPGISHLYSKEMVRRIVTVLDQQKNDPNYSWDFYVSDYLGLPFLTSTVSYIEHFGASRESMHSPEGAWDRDRATNPTPYLKDLRERVIAYLEGTGEKPQV